ncbi:hypothetical protein CDD81_6853 [Ophiocordyceps australis]|uniref:Uncharacterized protein n=1 Tax=Ophiocordyceps australis TaxID=1399860 RepID=A0A2C5X991_9HYPO|nr:hypothetical protein CDD81_6853 [Ophiocordyceps australis]
MAKERKWPFDWQWPEGWKWPNPIGMRPPVMMPRGLVFRLSFLCAGSRFGEDFSTDVGFWNNGSVLLDCATCPTTDFSFIVGRMCEMTAARVSARGRGFAEPTCYIITLSMRDHWPQVPHILVKTAKHKLKVQVSFVNGRGRSRRLDKLLWQKNRIRSLENCN